MKIEGTMSRVLSPGNTIPAAGRGLDEFASRVKFALGNVGMHAQSGKDVMAVMFQGRLFKIEISQLSGPQ